MSAVHLHGSASPDGKSSDVGEPRVEETILRARVYLSRVAEPGSLPVSELVTQLGPVEAAERIRAAEVPDAVRNATAARRITVDVDADLETAARHKIEIIVPESERWPHFALSALYRAEQERLSSWRAGRHSPRYGGEPTVPLVLWVRGCGRLEELGARSVAVVGSRASTAYGENLAVELGHDLAAREMTIVSGGAFGIDAAAHRGALAAEGSTALVAANGLDTAYPRAHARLFARVAETGLLISESPPGAVAQRHRFLSRNRLVAALSAGTIVVEAAARSGALNTAGHCQLLGRTLMAVPGPVTSAMSVGCHALLRHPTQPAAMVTSASDVLALVGPPTVESSGADVTRPDTTDTYQRRLDELDPIARAVVDGLPARGWVSEDELAVRSGVDTVTVLRALPVLQLAGLVDAGSAGYRLRRR